MPTDSDLRSELEDIKVFKEEMPSQFIKNEVNENSVEIEDLQKRTSVCGKISEERDVSFDENLNKPAKPIPKVSESSGKNLSKVFRNVVSPKFLTPL